MNDYDRAEYEAEMAAQAAAEVEHLLGQSCGWCGEPMSEPVIVDEGTIFEDYACAGECAEHARYQPCDDDREDFRADWDGRWSPEPEWCDYTGERLW